uniref:Uncharacterized protein n=1 Tax=Oryza brachyantha TaxID=4533 RepID=J3LV31_ORYBR
CSSHLGDSRIGEGDSASLQEGASLRAILPGGCDGDPCVPRRLIHSPQIHRLGFAEANPSLPPSPPAIFLNQLIRIPAFLLEIPSGSQR